MPTWPTYTVQKGPLSGGYREVISTRNRAQAFAVYFNIPSKAGRAKRVLEDGTVIKRDRGYHT